MSRNITISQRVWGYSPLFPNLNAIQTPGPQGQRFFLDDAETLANPTRGLTEPQKHYLERVKLQVMSSDSFTEAYRNALALAQDSDENWLPAFSKGISRKRQVTKWLRRRGFVFNSGRG